MSADEPEGFLGRWSRVKRSAARAVPEPEPAPETAEEPTPEADAPAEEPQPQLSEEDLAALPRIEDLVAGSDIRPFLRPGVPRALKNAALRRMWMLTPAIRDHNDPAVDYAWDWNTPGGVPGDGVAPSPERAAEMLKSLMSPRGKPAKSDAEGESAAVPEQAAPQPEGAAVEAPAEDAALSSEATSGPPAVQEPHEADPSEEPEPPPRRRHGSALPG